MRALQGVGGAMLFANSSAIITDAFPANQRGLALGINGVAAVAGSSIGLVLGGVLAPVAWRAVFLVSVPFGMLGTVWGFAKLRDLSERKPAKIDWWGNVTFAVGLIAVMIGITYGIQPYGHHTMGWTSPKVIAEIGGGILVLIAFCFIETRVEQPMFHLDLFKVRAFTAGNFASLLSGIGRGGLQFVLIIWLQGIYLPRHGYSFADTPLWAGIYLLPLVAGMLFAGPIAGALSDRMGPRPFAVAGMALAALSFLLLALLPVNFSYPVFALVIILNGLGMGIFFSPNRASIMNSLPANQRGAGGGMAATFMNSAMVLSIGIFFSLMIVGLSGGLHQSLYNGLTAHGVSAGRGAAGRQPAARGHPVRRVPRLQPDQDAARPPPPRRLGPPAARPARPHVLPVGHLRPVLQRADLGVHLRPGRLPDRRRWRRWFRPRASRGSAAGAARQPASHAG